MVYIEFCPPVTVGEPLPTAAWKWYYEKVGKEKCILVDTYWQTGTGEKTKSYAIIIIIISNLLVSMFINSFCSV